MTTFEPVGYRSIRTGVLMANLDSVYDYGVRNPRGRRMSEAEWETYVSENYETVYREIQVGDSSEDCEACARTGNGLACEDHFWA